MQYIMYKTLARWYNFVLPLSIEKNIDIYNTIIILDNLLLASFWV